MYQLMIVDDEYMILEGMKRLLDYHSLGINLACTCDSPTEALSYAKSHEVDILITDITMPGMSGLDLIQALKEIRHDIDVIIMSGFQEFEYARKAVSLGVKDYLVKPISKKELQVLLEGIVRQKKSSTPLGLDFLKGKAVTVQQLKEYLQLEPIYFVASMNAFEGAISQVERHVGQQLVYFSLFSKEQEQNFLYQCELDDGKTMVWLEQQVESVLFYGETVPTSSKEPDYTMWHSHIVANDLVAILEQLPDLERTFKQTLPRVAISKQFLIQLMVAIFEHFNRNNDADLAYLYSRINSSQTIEEAIERVRQDLEQLLEDCRFNSHVRTVLELIRQDYQQDLTLKQVSERLFLNPVYLGQIIKKETGFSFSELLNEERIKTAQHLLLSSDMSVEDICFYVGYNNVGYFYKMFKRLYHESPKSYREKVRKSIHR